MSNLRLMCIERYTDGSPSDARGYHVDAFQSLEKGFISCLGSGSSSALESAEVWLIEANDENGDTLDEVLLWSGERK